MPDFRDDAELDTSQVEDLRGSSGHGLRVRRPWELRQVPRLDLTLNFQVDISPERA